MIQYANTLKKIFFLKMNSKFIKHSKSNSKIEDTIENILPKESMLQIFSYLDVISLSRCAQVSKSWNSIALDGTNWQNIDLFNFQRDVEVLFFYLFTIFSPPYVRITYRSDLQFLEILKHFFIFLYLIFTTFFCGVYFAKP